MGYPKCTRCHDNGNDDDDVDDDDDDDERLCRKQNANEPSLSLYVRYGSVCVSIKKVKVHKK